ncbi:hypothetical protein HZC33_00695 [Candidatus Wolfebacteria bacterium]|nr:hypothetical protein [Candidatus Wolfebacteria bacterium]
MHSIFYSRQRFAKKSSRRSNGYDAKKICFSECLGRLKSLVSEGVFSLRAKLLIFRWKKSKSGSEKHIFLANLAESKYHGKIDFK